LRLPFVIGLAVLVASAGVGVATIGPARHGVRAARSATADNSRTPAIPVADAAAGTTDVPVYLTGVGTVQAFKTVTVHAQVDGKLLSVPFHEGQDVEPGDLLAKIDPVIFQAQYDQAVAKKAQDEAQLANARVDLKRYQHLAESNAGPKQQADTEAAVVAQLEAQLKSDDAAIESTRATLGYTTITSPIEGRTGIRLVDEGNIVHAADTNGIVVITQIRPISVVFTLPQQDLAKVNAAAQKGALPAEALAADNRTVIEHGTLSVVDNQVDQTTGTVRLKAAFPNKTITLWPGQFVNVRLLIDTLKSAVVVPAAAVQQGPNGPFVFVIGQDNTVTAQEVQVSQQDDTRAVIAAGVVPGTRVVTTGFGRLTNGSRVSTGAAASDAGQTPSP
jgi:multidrug efflux system membrane fusion protein